MIVTVQPSTIRGEIRAAASKSSMQRACAAALLTRGTSIIHNPGHSNDDLAAMTVITALGAVIDRHEDAITINSRGVDPLRNEVNCGESGLGIRMFAPLIALSDREIKVNGEGSLLKRPMDFFDEIFPQLGITVTSNNGKLPLSLKGPLRPKDITIDGSLSSQFLTGLLMAYAAAEAKNKKITVTNLKSRPYIDLTLQVMNHFGLPVPENEEYNAFRFVHSAPNTSVARVVHYTVEGDWSGAAFLLVAGAIAGNITVHGLDVFSTQADKAILNAIRDAGAGLSIYTDHIELQPLPLKAFHFNATDCPDLFPPLVALASFCEGSSVIEGVSRLAHKESNRALTLQEEFGKMGVEIKLQDDLMIIHSPARVKGAPVHSRHDHRIAMACAVAALKAEGETRIAEADAVNKSYPDFYSHLQKLGATLSIDETQKENA